MGEENERRTNGRTRRKDRRGKNGKKRQEKKKKKRKKQDERATAVQKTPTLYGLPAGRAPTKEAEPVSQIAEKE